MSAKTNSKRKKRGRIAIFAIEIILLLAVLVGLFVWSKYQKMDHGAKLDTEDLVNADLDESTQEVLQGFTNVALFGLDNRSNGNFESGNSDAIMIASINNDTKEVRLVSVYRDTYLNMSDDDSYNFQKANSAYNRGGPENAIRMLNRNLDLDIKDYVVVDFQALTEAIDLLGGVEVNIDDAMFKWINVYINETAGIIGAQPDLVEGTGVQNLSGLQATAYCRVRYTTGNDFRRAQRQREVLSKMIQKAQSAGIGTINDILDSIMDDISTNFTLTEMLALAGQMFQYELVETVGFPFHVNTKTISASKGDVVVPCDLVTNVTELHRKLFNDYAYTPSNTVQNYSQQIVYESGYTAESASETGISEDNYVDGAAGTDGTVQSDGTVQPEGSADTSVTDRTTSEVQ